MQFLPRCRSELARFGADGWMVGREKRTGVTINK